MCSQVEQDSNPLVAFDSASAARHQESSFARCGDPDVLRGERGKKSRKLGITHNFLVRNSLVSPLRYHRKEYWVFSSSSVCVFVSVCVSRSWMEVWFDLKKRKGFCVFDGKIHSHWFLCTSSPSPHPSDPKTPPPSHINRFCLYQHFLCHCLLPYYN